MNRRGMLWAALTSAGASLFAATASRAEAAKEHAEAGKAKVVYHLCDLDKVSFVLANIQNHFDGMGGPDKVTVELVIHGPALKAFHAASASHDVKFKIARFGKSGLALAACGNTMNAQNVALKDLLPGFGAADKGGVVRIAELQMQGYAYLKP